MEKTIVAPRDLLERQLIEICEEVLEVSPIGVTDSFLELGDSLQAVTFFAEIDNKFGKNLPLTTLLEAPTIEEIAAILREDGLSFSWSSLVPIQTGGTKPIFFLVHGAGGNILFANDLASNLGPDQPFYGLQSRGLDGEEQPFTSVECMASHYIDEVLTVQPKGPYFVGGYSMGGLVAFEMAHQLIHRGHEVGRLVLFDTRRPGSNTMWRGDISIGARHRAFEFSFGEFSKLGAKAKVNYLFERFGNLRTRSSRRIRDVVWKRSFDFYANRGRDLPKSLRSDLERVNMRVGRKYEPRPYSGNITFFQAHEQDTRFQTELSESWKDLATGGVDVHFVEGHHESMFHEPNVKHMSEKLRLALE